MSGAHAIALLIFTVGLVSAMTEGHRFVSLGTGVGHPIWQNGSIPYWINVTKAANQAKVSDTLAAAAAHISARTCVNFYEVAEPTNTPYVTVKDTKEGSCSAGSSYYYSSGKIIGSGILNYDGCGHQYLTVVHEMLHILGIGHEQKRLDSYDKIKLNESNVDPNFISQYTATFVDAHGEYDWYSLMHYQNMFFGNGNGITYNAARTTFNVQCKQMSDGDVATTNFVMQECWKEPVMPRCRSSAPSGITIGKLFDKNLSFTGLYKAENPDAAFSNMLEGGFVHRLNKYHGSVYKVELKPTANDLGKNFSLTATFNTSGGLTAACTIPVQVVTADYVCDGIPSTDSNVCSGHGVCNSYDYPQCQCAVGFEGPFCQGTTRCPADVAVDMEEDQQGRCLIPTNDTKINHVEGAPGEGLAANGTSLYFRLMPGIIRQPIEFSALVKISGEASSYSVSFDMGSFYIDQHRKINGVFMGDGWHHLRAFLNWEQKTYSRFVNGHWVGDGTISSYYCATLDSSKCTMDSVSASASTNGTIVLDRVRMECAASHIGATTSMELSAENRIDNDVSLMFMAPHPSYAWDASKLGDMCTATESSLLSGATFNIDSQDSRKLNITLPAVGRAAQPAGSNYITCVPASKHFTQSDLPVEKWSQKVFAINGLCAESGSITYEDVKDLSWSHNPKVPAQLSSLNLSVPFLPDSDWELHLFDEKGARVAAVNIKPPSSRFRTYNYSEYNSIIDDQVKNLTHANLTVTIDWTTASTKGLPTLTASLLNLTSTQTFNATTLTRVQMWYWRNSPNGTVVFDYGCPPAMDVAVPPMYPGAVANSSEAPQATNDTSSPQPSTNQPPPTGTTGTSQSPLPSDTTGSPTTTAAVTNTTESTTGTVNAQPTTDTEVTTSLQTNSTVEPNATADATSTVEATAVVPTPEPTTVGGGDESKKVVGKRLRLSGGSWSSVIDQEKGQLLIALRSDIALIIQVPAQFIWIVKVSVGSLVVEYDIQVDIATNETAIDTRVLAASSGSFSTTAVLYDSVNGGAIAPSVLEATTVSSTPGALPPTNAPTPTQAPSDTPAPQSDSLSDVLDGSSCSKGCVILVVIVMICVLFALVAFCVSCCRKKPQAANPSDKRGPHYQHNEPI